MGYNQRLTLKDPELVARSRGGILGEAADDGGGVWVEEASAAVHPAEATLAGNVGLDTGPSAVQTADRIS